MKLHSRRATSLDHFRAFKFRKPELERLSHFPLASRGELKKLPPQQREEWSEAPPKDEIPKTRGVLHCFGGERSESD